MRGISLFAFMLVMPGLAASAESGSFLGFRLLDLENQSVKWQTPRWRESAAVTYAFATGPVTTKDARNCGEILPPDKAYAPSGIAKEQFEHEVAAAFNMWERVADISFRKTDDPDTADIVIGAQAKPVGRAFTNVELKPTGTDGRKVIARSLICLNPEQPWKVGFDGDLDVYDLRYTIAHEAGHAIGLDHPSPAGQLMSYRYDERHQGLQPGDIQGAALLYGPRPSTVQFAKSRAGARPDGTPDTDDKSAGQPFGIGTDKAAR